MVKGMEWMGCGLCRMEWSGVDVGCGFWVGARALARKGLSPSASSDGRCSGLVCGCCVSFIEWKKGQ